MGGILRTYSDQVCDWLVEQGYTHCFFVAGGNIMHLLNSARTRFKCIPVIHEVSAGIAAEYFNELDATNNSKAFALVTAGPGLTNIITAIAGAHMESRALLVIGGQVKSSDLANGQVRQRGIQEIDGVSVVTSLCKQAVTFRNALRKSEFLNLESQAYLSRKGVVFFEICLDVQGQNYNEELNDYVDINKTSIALEKNNDNLRFVKDLIMRSERPIILVGGGVCRRKFLNLYPGLLELGIPLMGTWNGADRVPNDSHIFWGRPNTWGMRYSNILIQQSDLVIAVGTRLGLQHTGFNWQEFAPLAKIVQVDIDKSELTKGHPRISLGVQHDAAEFLEDLLSGLKESKLDISNWIKFGESVKKEFPLSDPQNNSFNNFWNPYDFMQVLSSHLRKGDVLVPSSSGAAETVAMQAAVIPSGAFVVTDKGMASMGYGLAGAIGAAFKTGNRVIHIEGDGGFAQNLQELGTSGINKLPIKTFIFDNGGYASIKMTQLNYYDGNIIGCDLESGLGLPNWEKLFEAFDISCMTIFPQEKFSDDIIALLDDSSPRAFLIPIHPDQTYYPKITSRMLPDGSMKSNPLHLMTPDLSREQITEFLPYLADKV
jgi:acetolactate synthase I/II/III large subunit